MADAPVKEESRLRPEARAIVDTTWVTETGLADGPGPNVQIGVERIEGYDWVRFIAAVNIVALHVMGSASGLIGLGGVSSFLMIATSLPAMRADLGPFGAFARRRAKRILIPWFCWSVFYGAIAGIRYLKHGTVPNWTIDNLFIGTSLHLWFFPVVYAGTLSAWILLRATRRWNTVRTALGVSALGAFLFALYAFTFSGVELPAPYGHWFYSVPALVIGVSLGLAWRARVRPGGRLLIASVGVMAISAAIVNVIFGQTRDGLSYCVAGLLVPAALLLPLHSNRFLKSFSDVSLGVYAAHPFLFLIFQSVTREVSLPAWFSVVVVVISALVFSKLLRRMPFGEALV